MDPRAGEWVDAALDRLAEIANDQARLHVSLSEVLSKQHESKTLAYFQADETTVEGRKHEANYAALEYTFEVHKFQGQLAANAEEQQHLRDMLTYVKG